MMYDMKDLWSEDSLKHYAFKIPVFGRRLLFVCLRIGGSRKTIAIFEPMATMGCNVYLGWMGFERTVGLAQMLGAKSFNMVQLM